jgi:hypothetical protein
VALSRGLAAWLSEDRRIQRFRDKHLGGNKLEWDVVRQWMRDQGAQGMEEANWYALMPVRPAVLWQAQAAKQAGEKGTITIETTFAEFMARDAHPRQVSALIPGQAIPHRETVKEDSALDELLELVTELLQAVPWKEEQASVFVLAGLTPLVTPWRLTSKAYPSMATMPRLVLEFDLSMTQREVAAAYQKAREVAAANQRLRDQVLASDSRHRDMSMKHLELAVFAILPEGREGSLAERMARWNAAHPEWAYRLTYIFSRDMKRARQRLLPQLHLYPEEEDEGQQEEAE